MSSLIPLKLQHSVEELRAYYRASSDAVERRRIQVVWFLAEGKNRSEVVKLTAYNRISICDRVKLYNAEGLVGLRDRRHENPGCPPLLSEEERTQLLEPVMNLKSNSSYSNVFRTGFSTGSPPYTPTKQVD